MNETAKTVLKRCRSALTTLSGKAPPRSIPGDLLARYTMDGKIPVQVKYRNDVGLSFLPIVYSGRGIKTMLRKVENRQGDHYEPIDKRLYRALDKHPIEGKSCVVMGSVSPFYESMCLQFGATDVTTIEYNKLVYLHPQIKTLRPDEYERDPIEFDVGFSISSFEHDGLGRYGDPLNPDGDLKAMQNMKKTIRSGGLLFLSVPVGRDCLVWNEHRIYGRLRFERLCEGWELLEAFDFKDSCFEIEEGKYTHPVFVLRNA